MPEDDSRAKGEDLETLLEMNQQLREEVRAHGKRKSRRYLGSLTALGVIIGYLFTTNGDARVLVLVPFVLGFLYLSHISSMNYVVQLAALLALIEAKINYPGAEYEYYHGGFSIAPNPNFTNIDRDIDQPSHGRKTILSPVKQWLRGWGIRRIEGERNDPEVLQHAVQSRVRDGMHLLAVMSYLGAAAIGTIVLSTRGIPALGIIQTDAVLMSIVLLGIQFGIFAQVIIAWSAYRQHRAVLLAGVKDMLDNDGFNQGIQNRTPTTGSN